jgi:CRP-like cAMP-binding protein
LQFSERVFPFSAGNTRKEKYNVQETDPVCRLLSQTGRGALPKTSLAHLTRTLRGKDAMETLNKLIASLREENRFFHLFDDEELAVLIPLFNLALFQPGQILIEEGDPAGGPFSIVLSGSLEVKKKAEFGSPIVLAKVGRGALLGYSSILQSSRPFPITAVAMEKTQILYVPPPRFVGFLDQYPAIGVKILKEIIRVQDARLEDLLARFTALM